MPKFRVTGCLKVNAEDVEVIIEAKSYKDAQRIAGQKGILVSDVFVFEERYRQHRETNHQSERNAAKSDVSRTLYVLTGLLPGLLLCLFGIHNLIAGYSTKGALQLLLSIFCWFLFVSSFLLVAPACLLPPFWVALVVMTIVEVCTVKVDGQGKPFS